MDNEWNQYNQGFRDLNLQADATACIGLRCLSEVYAVKKGLIYNKAIYDFLIYCCDDMTDLDYHHLRKTNAEFVLRIGKEMIAYRSGLFLNFTDESSTEHVIIFDNFSVSIWFFFAFQCSLNEKFGSVSKEDDISLYKQNMVYKRYFDAGYNFLRYLISSGFYESFVFKMESYMRSVKYGKLVS